MVENLIHTKSNMVKFIMAEFITLNVTNVKKVDNGNFVLDDVCDVVPLRDNVFNIYQFY